MKTTTKKKGVGAAARGFMCGCGGSKSVSIVVSRAAAANISAVTTPLTTSSATTTATSAAKTTTAPASHDADASAEGTPSVDALLRQLRELESGVRALGVRDGCGARGSVQACSRRPRHQRSASDWGAGRGRLEEESVAVATESADPLGDFRRSMVQMVVENKITGGAELRELLQRFLSLNSARHHHLILRAFADVWEELFAGGQPLPRPQKSRRALELASVHTAALH